MWLDWWFIHGIWCSGRVLVWSDWSPTHGSLVYSNKCILLSKVDSHHYSSPLSCQHILTMSGRFFQNPHIYLRASHTNMSFHIHRRGYFYSKCPVKLTHTFNFWAEFCFSVVTLSSWWSLLMANFFFFGIRLFTLWLFKNQNHQTLQYEWLSPSLKLLALMGANFCSCEASLVYIVSFWPARAIY